MAKKLSEGRKAGSGRKPGTAKTLAEGRKVGSGRKKGSGGKTIGKTLAEGRKAGSGRKKGSKGTPKSDDANSTHSDDSSLLSNLNDVQHQQQQQQIQQAQAQQHQHGHHQLLTHQDLINNQHQQQVPNLSNYHPQLAQQSYLNSIHFIQNQDHNQQHQPHGQNQFPSLANFQQHHQPHQILNAQQQVHAQSPTQVQQRIAQDDRMKYNDIKLIINDLNSKNTIENAILPFNRSRQD